jgi:hypothetical protein
VRPRLKVLARAVDTHPVIALFTFWTLAGSTLTILSYGFSTDLLLANAGGTRRSSLYGQIASTTVAVLAATLTVLSILLALPDRPRVAELRKSDAWRLLQGMLLATAAACLAALILAELGIALDTASKPHQRWIEHWCMASVISGLLGILVSGAFFGLLLKAVSRPSDPSTGRGAGSAGGCD